MGWTIDGDETKSTPLGTTEFFINANGQYRVHNIMHPPHYWQDGILTEAEWKQILAIVNRANRRFYRLQLKNRKVDHNV